MFSVKSLVIREQELSDYDKKVVELFRRIIFFKDNKYYVQLRR